MASTSVDRRVLGFVLLLLPGLGVTVASCSPSAAERAATWSGALEDARQNVLTQHNDRERTGAALHETTLDTHNVAAATFGKLYTRRVDGDVYAQPLYVANVDMAQRGLGVRSVLVVATMKNVVYAFDARETSADPNAGLLWAKHLRSLGEPESGRIDDDGKLPPPGSLACPSASAYGITSTPVIDAERGWIYLVSKTWDGTRAHQYLMRLDLATGEPVVLPGEVSPTEIMAQQGGLALDPRQLNRASLLLSDGRVYVAFAGHCDQPYDSVRNAAGVPIRPDPQRSYHGWVLSYDAAHFDAPPLAWVTTPDDARGGIWQSGNGIAADAAGNVYFQTGNRTGFPLNDPSDPSPARRRDGEPGPLPQRNASDRSEAFVSLATRAADGSAVLADRGHYTPGERAAAWPDLGDYRKMDTEDLDLGSSGPLVIPDAASGTIVGGGKQGRLYLIDADAMRPVQSFKAAVNASFVETGEPDPHARPEDCVYGDDTRGARNRLCPHIHAGLVYWHGPEDAFGRVYVWAERDYLRAYKYGFADARFVADDGHVFTRDDDLFAPELSTPPNGQDRSLMPLWDANDGTRIMPGATLSLSANERTPGTGIVWALQTLRDNAEYKNVYGVLRAFDAVSLREIWSSGTDQFGEDFLGKTAKLTPVTVANGTVFAATFSNQIVAYGLKSRREPGVAPWQGTVDIGARHAPPQAIPATAQVTPLSRDGATLDLFMTDANGALLNAGFRAPGGQWHWGYGIRDASFANAGAPVAAVARAPGIVDLFVARPDGSIWDGAYWIAGSPGSRPYGWSEGYALAGAGAGFASSDPAAKVDVAASVTATTSSVYAVKSNGAVALASWWSASHPGTGAFGWNAGCISPATHAGLALPTASLAVVRTPEGDADEAFVVAADGSVWDAGAIAPSAPCTWNVAHARAITPAGFVAPSARITVLKRRSRATDLFVVRKDGSVWNAAHREGGIGASWNAGYPIADARAGLATSGAHVAAVARDADHVDLYVVGADGRLWNAGYWTSDPSAPRSPYPFGWQPPYLVGGDVAIGNDAFDPQSPSLSARVSPSLDPAGFVTALAIPADPMHVDLVMPGKNGQVFSVWWDARVR